MQLKGRALVVDDQAVWLELFEELLHELGLEVVTARTYQDAINLLDCQYFHLAVIDVRLSEDDLKNTQGMDILSHINQAGLGDVVAKIVITGYGTREGVRESFKTHGVHDFIPKQGPDGKGFDEKDFIKSVKSAFAERLKINLELDMEFVHGLSLKEMVSRIRRDNTDPEPAEHLYWEMDDLLRKLFPDARSLVVSRVSGGHSKTSVVKVEPFYEGRGQAEALIVKYGWVNDIKAEADNFAEHVKRFMASQRHTNLDCQARTRLLGGIVYSLIGAPFERVRSFSDFYLQTRPEQICLVLDDLFDQNCRRWYENRFAKKTRNLAELYWRDVGATLEKLTACFQRMYREFADQPTITLYDLQQQFVNPLHHRFVRDMPIYLPVHTAITHGDLNGDNLFVDQDNHAWMIDFFRTGEGHIMRDFVELESVIKFQLLEEVSLKALYEFEKAMLVPVSFTEALTPPQIPMSDGMTKALMVIGHVRELAGKVIQPGHDMHDYYAGLFYHTLNLIRHYHLLELRCSTSYLLLSAAMLCSRLETLASMRSGGI